VFEKTPHVTVKALNENLARKRIAFSMKEGAVQKSGKTERMTKGPDRAR